MVTTSQLHEFMTSHGGRMKVTRTQQRFGTRSPLRAVSLHVREYQVTVKVNRPVPVKTSSLR